MKKEVYICYHCGKEFDLTDGNIFFDFGSFGGERTYDFCDDCTEKAEKMIAEFCGVGGNLKIPF